MIACKNFQRAGKLVLLLLCAGLASCYRAPASSTPLQSAGGAALPSADTLLVPIVDYHRHLQSPAAALRGAEPPQASVVLPADLASLLALRTQYWNDPRGLERLYTEKSTLLDPTGPRWIRGKTEVASRIAGYFRAPYQVTPIGWSETGKAGFIAGYFTRGDSASKRYLGHVLLAVERGEDGTWRIAGEAPQFAGPISPEPITADQLVSDLDQAGIRRAVVLSLAYWFGSPNGRPVNNERSLVRAENDWTAEQAARYPNRLVAFCSFNPLKPYALEELQRCQQNPHISGLKLHFANSGVDLRNPEHAAQVRKVFSAANELRLPIVVHLWVPDPSYGREHSMLFLDQVLVAAPDVVVQIAHFAGGGGAHSDAALSVFADAIAARDPRTRNVYFDLTGVSDGRQSPQTLQTVAQRIRQIGPQRMLFGSDMAPPPAWQPWFTFRMTVPLTAEEFRTIAGNVAPYLRCQRGASCPQ